MGKSLLLSIEVGLKDRATKGLQAIGGQVKGMSANLASSLGGSKLFGGMARSLDGLGSVATAVIPELGVPLMILGTGLKAAMAGVEVAGSVIGTVFRGIGTAITAAARVGIQGLQSLASFAGRAAKGLALVGLAAGGMAILAAKSCLDAAMQMEGFLAKLTTATKSESLGKQWLEWARQFAATTPFNVAEVTDAATRLLLQGFNPNALMTNIGNMAGAMNKPITDAVEAYLDATRGEWERIKEFGINPRNLVAFGAKKAGGGGIDTQTEEGAKAAKKALDALISSRYGGGMAAMMKTAAGQISNLEDAIFKLRVTIGRMLLPILKAATAFGGEFVTWLESMKVGESVGAWLALAGARILWFGKAIAFVIQQVAGGKSLGAVLVDVIGQGFGERAGALLGGAISGLLAALGRLGAALQTAFTGITAGVSVDPVSIIANLVVGIAEAIDWLTTNVFAPGKIEGIVKWLQDLAKAALTIGGQIAAGIMWAVSKIGGVEAIVGKVGGFFRYLVDWGKYLVGWVYTKLPNILDVVTGLFAGIARVILNVADAITGFKAVWDMVFFSLATVVLGVVTSISSLFWLLVKQTQVTAHALAPIIKALSFGKITIDLKAMDTFANDVTDFTKGIAISTVDMAKKVGAAYTEGVDAAAKTNAMRDRITGMEGTAAGWSDNMRKWQATNGFNPAAKPGSLGSYMPKEKPTGAQPIGGGAFGVPQSMLKDAYGAPVNLSWNPTPAANANAPVGNTYNIYGGDEFLLRKIEELNRQQDRERRWAPTGQ